MATEILSCEMCVYHKDHTKVWTMKGTSVIRDKTHTHTWIECRRKPPTVVPDGAKQKSVWPVVEVGDWCGEWSVTFK